jgi:hypothetical protein
MEANKWYLIVNKEWHIKHMYPDYYSSDDDCYIPKNDIELHGYLFTNSLKNKLAIGETYELKNNRYYFEKPLRPPYKSYVVTLVNFIDGKKRQWFSRKLELKKEGKYHIPISCSDEDGIRIYHLNPGTYIKLLK